MKTYLSSLPPIGRSSLAILAAAVSMVLLPSAQAQQPAQPQLLGAAPEAGTSQQEVQQYCGTIVDAARDQRYLLQKQDLEKLQADVNDRIKMLETRRAEYEEWLKRRDDFMEKAKAGLVDIYRTSKADEVAPQFDEMDISIAAAIIMRLPPRQSSQILSAMDAKKAATVARIMASAVNPQIPKDPS
ncbi:flagellar protein [Neorhizobium lilium]|uniref:Flagellar protein n=1 Tax=Neorhizobium lilium TaxID=2503024 RepID=A0A3S3SXG6_9HYPH|nr:MotE family protein [Neorhizobium lilium]RWX77010.1 flagellar protein [Neorhizobium lilium]